MGETLRHLKGKYQMTQVRATGTVIFFIIISSLHVSCSKMEIFPVSINNESYMKTIPNNFYFTKQLEKRADTLPKFKKARDGRIRILRNPVNSEQYLLFYS